MPLIVVAFVGFACGWSVGAGLVAIGWFERHYRAFLGFLVFVAALLVLGITLGEANHRAWAFKAEETLVEQRWCTVVLWIAAGFAIYPYRTAIGAFLANATAVVLKSPPPEGSKTGPQDENAPPPGGDQPAAAPQAASPPASGESDDRVPTNVPAAASGAGGNASVLQQERTGPTNQAEGAVAPVPDRKRADPVKSPVSPEQSKYLGLSLPWFVEAGLFGAILIAAVFAFNPKALNGLTSFKAGGIEAHFAASGPVLQKGQVAVLDANRKSVQANWQNFDMDDLARAEIYHFQDVKPFKFTFSDQYFKDQLNLVFDVLYKREFSYLKLSATNFGLLQDLSTRLANQIARDLDKTKAGNTPIRQIDILKKVSQQILLFVCGTNPEEASKLPSACKDTDAIKHARCAAERAQADVATCGVTAVPAVVATVDAHYKDPKNQGVAENIWDPYVIQAVADLLGRSLSNRDRANFLEMTTTFLERDQGVCNPDCPPPTPGYISLVYAAVEAKVESEQPWPFDHMFQQVSGLLDYTRTIVDDDEYQSVTHAVARRNRLIDLSLGLQLFYQRALAGHHFKPAQLAAWSRWLKETRSVLGLVEDVGSESGADLNDREKDAWIQAKKAIEADKAVVQDAVTAAALSSVLLPAQRDGTTGADCVEARSLMDFASNQNLARFYREMRFDPDEKATYKGLIDQMNARVESECE